MADKKIESVMVALNADENLVIKQLRDLKESGWGTLTAIVKDHQVVRVQNMAETQVSSE